jgi:hypothetical protein
MNDVPAASDETAARDRAFRRLRRHVLAYAAVNGAFILIDLLTPGPWWFFWPMFGWGVAVAAHWLYVKSVHIDEIWAQQRTEDIRLQAHDLGHIEDIAKRHETAEARRRSGAGPAEKNHIETVREKYEKLASRFEGKDPGGDDGPVNAAPEPDETSEKSS